MDVVIPANTQAYMFVVRDDERDKFDVKKFVYNYQNTPFPPAWGYWKMDESSGDRLDSSGNNRTLTETGGTLNADGSYAHFTDYSVSLQRTDNPNLNGINFTYALWIKADYLSATGQQAVYLDSGSSAVVGISITYNTGTSKWYVEAYTEYDFVWTKNLVEFDDLTEHFVAVYFDGSNFCIDIDNVNAISSPGATQFDYDTSGYDLMVYGAYPTTKCEGWIKHCGIWIGDNALTSGNRSQLWNSGAGWSPY